MSIWTQVFLVNIIVFVTWVLVDRGLFNDKMEKWLEKGAIRKWVFTIYVLMTMLSFPVWLIYLVIA